MLLPQSFYDRDALDVAHDVLGAVIVLEEVKLRITEVEAYRHGLDSANHCRSGRTKRNAPMWGPPGHAYIYLCYGMHWMLNLVTNAEGEGAAVLVRGCEPIEGLERIRSRRGNKNGPVLLTGPGKVGAALNLDQSFNHMALFESGGLEVHSGKAPQQRLAGPRVGIGYADPKDIEAPWRLAIADNPWVSHPKPLRPLESRSH